jgi:hypothetical protein
MIMTHRERICCGYSWRSAGPAPLGFTPGFLASRAQGSKTVDMSEFEECSDVICLGSTRMRKASSTQFESICGDKAKSS